MVNVVEVKTSARLHLGFYNYLTDNVAYGSIGVAIDKPLIRIIVRKSSGLRVKNYTGISVWDVIDNVVDKLGIRDFELEIYSMIPRHVGLGSTTQLTLSIAYALNILYGLGYTIEELAVRTGRGFVSGIGLWVFKYGGLIFDSGRTTSSGRLRPPRNTSELPQPITRISIPGNWRFIVLIPRNIKGLHGRREEEILSRPRRIPVMTQYRIYKILLLKLIPSILRNNPRGFGEALTEIQVLTGKYFARYQGGIYCCRESEIIANILAKHGVYGVGQSSWGPTIYGLVDTSINTRKLLREIIRDIENNGVSLSNAFIAKPRNRGVIVSIRSE
jgi:beta-ribofuranosylaminobenzene 5'-phosphate synthase